jgi:hypothetical protein
MLAKGINTGIPAMVLCPLVHVKGGRTTGCSFHLQESFIALAVLLQSILAVLDNFLIVLRC